MTARDWRSLPASDLAGWYEAERARWASSFDWDTRENWTAVESARSEGRLPGLVLCDGETMVGWSFHLLHGSALQIGGVTAGTATDVGRLLDATLESSEAACADAAMSFLPDVAPGFVSAWTARGFSIRSFHYLVRVLDGSLADGEVGRSFQAGRLAAMTDLLRRAYPEVDPARPFAPGGTLEEWDDYTTQLVAQTGCGQLLPMCSLVQEQPGRPGRLVGGVLATRISTGTGHLAQVAVDPAWQSQGMGTRLVQSALGRLRARGFARASLLVADTNARARHVYQRLGFTEGGMFLSAWRRQPRLSTMAACSTGGVSTLR